MINGVSFGNDINALIAAQPSNSTAPQDAIGAYCMHDECDKAEFSQSSNKGVKTIATLAVIAAALGLARGKMGAIKEIDLSKSLKDTEGFMGKVKWVIAQGGEGVIKAAKHTKALFSKSAKLELKNEKMAALEKKIASATDDLTAKQKAVNELAPDATAEVKKLAEDAKTTAQKTLDDLNAKKTKLEKEINALGGAAKADAPKEEAPAPEPAPSTPAPAPEAPPAPAS